MGKKWIVSLALMFIVPGLLFTASCAKKTVQTETAAVSEAGEDEAVMRARAAAEEAKRAEMEAAKREAERQRLLEEQRLKEEAARQAMMAARDQLMSENIYFEFDSSALSAVSQDILKRKANWLRNNPNAYVVIEGHCDERGTNEYNLALGDRRANSAKTFLVDLGISASRLKTISYGEERPADPRSNEEAWAKNRRAQFVLE